MESDLLDITLDNVRDCVYNHFHDKIPILMKNQEDVVLISRVFSQEAPVPIFLLSSVNGNNMNLFKNFLNLLPLKDKYDENVHLGTQFYIHDKYIVEKQNIT